MQTRSSVHIASTEWRWVVLVGCGLVLLAFLPLLWVALIGTGDWQFMGALHNYLDGATYLSKMTLGVNGNWMVVFQHTPETHTGAFIQIVYPLLGHVSRLTGIPPIVMFHVARVFSSLFMYAALYQLGASIWTRVRTRRVFFIIASVGAGLGWLFSPLMQLSIFPDFPLLPEAFPFYSTLVNVHFPLTLACLALLAGLFVTVFRPGAEDDPTLELGWLPVAVLSLALALLYPQALVPIGAGIGLFAAVLFLCERRLSPLLLRWLLALVLPPTPFFLYYLSIVIYNPTMAEWNSQNVTAAPPLWALLVGFGLPLLVGLPAIYRSVRRFERDGDRFMLLWLLCIVVAVYLPTNVQRRFAVGAMLPIAYFATRAIEDVWLPRLARRSRRLVFAVFVPVIALSQLLLLFFPVLPILTGTPERAVGVFLPREYRDVFEWLQAHAQPDDVILAAPVVSAWIPGWAGARVVYGHPYETMDAEIKLQAVSDWYGGTSDCAALLEAYQVHFVLYGPEEAKLGTAPCLADLRIVARSGDAAIYAP
jgi:hypothetical protein